MTVKTNNSSGVVVTTAVATAEPIAATDVEAQKPQQASAVSAASAAANSGSDPEAGKGLGIAMFFLLIIAFVCTFFLPIVSFVCLIATIAIASAITCNCCCTSDYNLQPEVKKYATATLVMLCLMFIVQIIWLIGAAAGLSVEASNTGTISQSSMNTTSTSAVVVGALSLVFNVMAIIFSALYTWKR